MPQGKFKGQPMENVPYWHFIALMEQQVIEWKLPPAPAKETDSRTAN